MKHDNINALFLKARDDGDFHNNEFISALKDYGVRYTGNKMKTMPKSIALAFRQNGSPENVAYSAIFQLLRVLEQGRFKGETVGGFFTKALSFAFRDEFKSLAHKGEEGSWGTKEPVFVSLDALDEDERDDLEYDILCPSGERDRVWEYCEQFYDDATREQQVAFDISFDFNLLDGGFKRQSIERGAAGFGMTKRSAERLIAQVKEQTAQKSKEQEVKPPKPKKMNQYELVAWLKDLSSEKHIA